MADLTSLAVGSTTLGANYLKAETPFSRFGTRELTFYKITGYTGVATGAGNANSTYSQILRGVQSVTEVYYASAASANVVIVAVALNTDETTATAAQGNSNAVASLKAAIEAVAGGTATVASTGIFQTS